MLMTNVCQTGSTAFPRILVVDDEPQVLVALQDLLEDDFEVEATDEPKNAIRMVESDPTIAVVLTDQRMPSMNGDELLARVRESSQATRMLCTGYADLQAVVRSVNEGRIFAYVTKPWDGVDLRLKIHHAADHFRLNHELAYEKQLLADLMNNIPDAIFFKDVEQRYVRVNAAFKRGTGDHFGPIIGKRLTELLGSDNVVALGIEAREREILANGIPQRDVLHYRVDAERTVSSSTTRAAVRSPEGKIVGLVGVAQDISEIVKAQDALRSSEERLRLAFLASNSGVLDWNLQTGEVLYSPTNRPLTLSGPVPVDSISVLEARVHSEDIEQLRQAVKRHLSHRTPLRNLEMRAKDEEGNYRWYELSAQAAWGDDGQAVRLVGSISDVTQRREQHSRLAQLDHLLLHDELTGLPNRAHFRSILEQHLAAASARSESLAVVVTDLTRFRHWNEALGRRSGDEVLQEVAGRMVSMTPEGSIVSRLQNDVFGFLMPGIGHESDAAQWLQKSLLPQFERPFVAGDQEFSLALKAGIGIYPSDAQTADALIGHAETALKQAKNSPHPYLFYAPSMNGRVAERLRLESKLRRALAHDEFVLFYQPKVELKSGEIVGLEALIRWQDPEVGLVPPGTFIPLLEETELILPVGRWVMQRAAQQYRQWKRLDIPVPRIAVNVSALQLAQADFIGMVDAVIESVPEATEGLDIELTESVLMTDLSGNIDKLRAVKKRGMQVAIDDFGTGYSSLGYLSRLPLDALKVDRSFIGDMADDPQQMSIVTAIISLAHAIDLKVIAEGVETSTQSQLLRLLRCDQVQGYLLAKPQPAEAILSLLGKPLEIPRANRL